MKTRLFISRCIAFFLLLVFSQKMGAGLLLHNLFHGELAHETSGQKQVECRDAGYSCSCVEDLHMPFTAPGESIFSLPVLPFSTPCISFEENFSSDLLLFSFLRGPPFCRA